MNGLLSAGLLGVIVAGAHAQAIHHGYIWIEGPESVLQANTTYTLEVWGRWESPLFVEHTSAMAWFAIDVLNTRGMSSVAAVSPPRFALWSLAYGEFDSIDGTNILGVQSGQLPGPDGTPDGNPDLNNPLLLFQFDITTAGGPIGVVEFAPANPGAMGGLAFYPYRDGFAIAAPNDAETELHLTGWTSVPSPGAIVAMSLGATVARRKR